MYIIVQSHLRISLMNHDLSQSASSCSHHVPGYPGGSALGLIMAAQPLLAAEPPMPAAENAEALVAADEPLAAADREVSEPSVAIAEAPVAAEAPELPVAANESEDEGACEKSSTVADPERRDPSGYLYVSRHTHIEIRIYT